MPIYSTTVTAGASYPASTAPDVTIPFEPKSIVVVNEDTSNNVSVSLDGTNDAFTLVPGILPALRITQRATKIWLKRAGGTPSVQVIAESGGAD